jgi:hypothetical protein
VFKLKLNLIESLGKRGVLTQCKAVLKDKLEVEVEDEGIFAIVSSVPSGDVIRKEFKSTSGVVIINDTDIVHGVSHVEFVRADGVVFNCGELHRNGRFIHTKSNADELVVFLALGYLDQEKTIEGLKNEIIEIKTRYGISII